MVPFIRVGHGAITALIGFALLIPAGCAGGLPPATATASATAPPASPTPVWTPSPSPTAPSPTGTATPTAPPPGVFALEFYPPLVLDYDPAQWQDASRYGAPDQMVNYLQSRVLTTCRIGVHGPSGVPDVPPEAVQLGKVRYQVLTFRDTDPLGRWYMEDQTVPGFDYTNAIPVLTLQAGADAWQRCVELGDAVFATLRVP